MKIKKVLIKNFKSKRDYKIEFDKDLNIFVGDNDTGKSTMLDAINLALTGRLNGYLLTSDISPYLFNKEVADEYLKEVNTGKKIIPPVIIIEVYFFDDVSKEDNKLLGTQNTLKEGALGIHLEIKLNDENSKQYYEYLSEKIKANEEIKTIPTEYYHLYRRDFSDNMNGISLYERKYNPIFIDTTTIKIQNGNDYFVQNIINETLEPDEQKNLSIKYKELKETFSEDPKIGAVNKKLTTNSEITGREMNISLDISSKNSWLRNLVSYIGGIPLSFIGKGEQNKIKINLALNKGKGISDVVLIDEPENHLSFSRLNSLIKNIRQKSKDKQLIIVTHSHFITNKLGLKSLYIFNNLKEPLSLSDLNLDTQNYFKKLSDYDTLRLALSKKVILVEGPSDSLIVQKIYKQNYKILPIEDTDPVDIIAVRGLAFKRFLDIAKHLDMRVAVITDNDGNKEKALKRIKELKERETDNIKIFTDNDTLNSSTLEPSLLNVDGNEKIIKNILEKKDTTSKDDLLGFMVNLNNKTDVALKIFDSEEKINAPKYIRLAIEYVKK